MSASSGYLKSHRRVLALAESALEFLVELSQYIGAFCGVQKLWCHLLTTIKLHEGHSGMVKLNELTRL